jgi:hypothetical protein
VAVKNNLPIARKSFNTALESASVQTRMRVRARERLPSATAAYLEAYVALELSASKTQTLVDQLRGIALALTDAGTFSARKDAWKVARIHELPTLRSAAGELSQSMRLTKMPRAEQILDAIANWRKKRSYLQQLWNTLPAEVQMMLKVPETLD